MRAGLTPAVVEELQTCLGPRGVVTHEAGRRTYETDGLTGYRVLPAVVVLPETAEHVQAIMRIAAQANLPVVPRGSGTGLSGGALPRSDGILLVTSRMRKVIEVDPVDRIAVVEPGVINSDVSRAAARFGLHYAPDPSSQQVCSIGGNVAENSGGAHCLKYGFTAHHTLAVELVTIDGERVWLGSETDDGFGFDLRGLVLGSEGTLGVVTKVVVRLLPLPEARATLVADFHTPRDAGDAVTAIIQGGIVPAAVEMLDTLAIEACEAAVGAGFTRGAGAALVVELDGPAPGLAAQLEHVADLCRREGAHHVRIAQTESERALIWKGRKAAFAAMGRLAPDYFVQDGVIPRTKLGEVLAEIAKRADAAGLRVANVFHAGDGNLHPLVLYDGKDVAEAERAEKLSTEVAELCVAYGGSITGEHGVGVDKACSMPAMFAEVDLAVMDRVRGAFDPGHRMNPDKQLPTPRLCGEVPGKYRPHRIEALGLGERF